MPRLERKIDIETTPEKIFKIVSDGFNTPRWNLAVESVVEINNNKIQLDTDIGGMIINKTETKENKNVTWFTEGSEIKTLGYIITPKKEKITKVSIWTEFNDKKRSKLFKETADNILMGLKSYAEYLEAGGDPEVYKKWEVITIP